MSARWNCFEINVQVGRSIAVGHIASIVSVCMLGGVCAASPIQDKRPVGGPVAKLNARIAWHGRNYTPPKHYLCHRAATPLKIDGKLIDDAWKAAPWTEQFVDIEGDRKPKPRFKTRVKMLWDDRYFYIAAELEDPHVWGTLTKHDSVIFHDNDFEVFIDPDGDNHKYMEYEINALGTDWDLYLPKPYKDKGKADNSWEIPGLKKAVHVYGTLNDPRDTDKGWTVEMAFPWKELGKRGGVKVPPGEGEQWRVNFSRVQWQHKIIDGKYRKIKGLPEDNWVWSPQWVINMHRPETWGYVQFTKLAPGKAKFIPDPTGHARHVLHRILYAQRAFRNKHQRWAKDLAELGLAKLKPAGSASPPQLAVNGDRFSVRAKSGADQCLAIDQDARIVVSRIGNDAHLQQRPQPWQRRAKPVLSAYTTRQSWCKVVLYSPHVLFHEGKFRMWYLGTSTASRSNDIAMGYAESADGYHWKEHRDNPILTGDDVPWGKILQTPFVLFDKDARIFKMWFVSGAGVLRDKKGKILQNDQRLGYATSRDGISWKIHPKPIFPSGRSPSVIKEGPKRYRMWMGSRPDPNGPWDDIYKNIYEFSSEDGIDWKRTKKPVIRPSGKGRSTVYPFVLKNESMFHMWYGCHTKGKFEIFHATSKNGSNWSIDHDKSAFPARNKKGFFDSRYTSTPCIVRRPDRWLLYYSARDMKTTYIDKQGRKRTDGAGIYAHIGVAELRTR